jgi:hypothetical protein
MDTDILRAIPHYKARGAIGSSSMRGAGSAGVVERARASLGEMDLRPFGTLNRAYFLDHLDGATENPKPALPKREQR